MYLIWFYSQMQELLYDQMTISVSSNVFHDLEGILAMKKEQSTRSREENTHDACPQVMYSSFTRLW
jgi:hypothetical protein